MGGTAAATTFYFFIGLACIALVLQTIVPRVGPFEIGNGWYALTLLSPLAWTYYFRTGDARQADEEVEGGGGGGPPRGLVRPREGHGGALRGDAVVVLAEVGRHTH